MTFCDFSTPLKFIMYTKYIYLFLYIFLIIFYLVNRKKEFDKSKLKKVIKITTFILILYFIIAIILSFTNFNIKKCFLNSNPLKMDLSEKLTDTYNSYNIMESTDLYVKKVEPTETKKVIGRDELKIFNQNIYPLSNYEFTFSKTQDAYTYKKSGTELATLATIISSLPHGEDANPTKILEYLKYSDADFSESFDMDQALSILSNQYDFLYKPITSNEIIGGIRNGGIVMARVYSNSYSNIFTCTNSYIIIYNYDSSEKFSVVSVNDKDYDYICPIGTPGFGNIIKANINNTSYNYEDVTFQTNYFYLIWR